MANIYIQDEEPLHNLLDRARRDDGANLLIPDLQRPFVWTPNQVALLVDSLIRGWPFGTLLLWKVRHDELKNIPNRPFWRVIDRTDGDDAAAVAAQAPPGEFDMVLDGQQRIQSLLLALGGDTWGFKLEDRTWAEQLQDRRPRGRQGRYRHWSKASLCFDLDTFLVEYQKAGSIWGVDYRTVLCWIITEPNGGQSAWPKPDNYAEPVPKSSASPGRYIRMSRLWQTAGVNPNVKEAQFRAALQEFLPLQEVPNEKINTLLNPLAELMTTLRDVKLSDVTFLQLLPFDPEVWTEDDYNDAIVNIFTRLNTAGRTLTREEITFAWLKVGWDALVTGNQSATSCFKDLGEELAKLDLKITTDELVSGVSLLWSVKFNNGKLLTNRDLLRGESIKPMASALSANWNTVIKSILTVTEAVGDQRLEYGTHYLSFNALALIWAWRFIGDYWMSQQSLKELERDDFIKKQDKIATDFIDRWFICSQWAGRWAAGTATNVATYAANLYALACKLESTKNLAEAIEFLREHLESEVRGLESEAVTFITSLHVNRRDVVRSYYTPLWLWHRLDDNRWKQSQIQLREKKKKKVRLEVDHIVAFRLWENKLEQEAQGGTVNDERLGLVNQIGNCFLLEKSFNISKSDKPLQAFIEQVSEFKDNTTDETTWSTALSLEKPQIESATATSTELETLFEKRTALIREELADFARGKRVRQDL